MFYFKKYSKFSEFVIESTNSFKPKTKDELKQLIYQEIKDNGDNCDLNHIDISLIDDISYLFSYSHGNKLSLTLQWFNGDVSKWNTSNITNMQGLFSNSKFDGDISKWNTSNVTNMSHMFNNSYFNGDISKWNTSKVTNMSHMFNGSRNFTGDISNWNTSNVTDMNYMFAYNKKFISNISKWDVSNVTNMKSMFYHSNFIVSINNWNTAYMKDKTYVYFNDAFTGSLFEKNKQIPKWYIDSKSYLERGNNL